MVVGVLATDGEDFVSDKHAEQAQRAHEAGLDVWHYHFCRPENDPAGVGEASHFWAHVKPHYQRGDRLVLDVEQRHPQGLAALCSYVASVDTRLHNISGVAAVGYTFDSLLREAGRHLQVISGHWWIAKPDGLLAPLGAGRRCIARQVRLDGVGKGPVHFAGVEGYDVDQLKWWYARALAADRRRRHKSP
jgi:hypothetical protein